MHQDPGRTAPDTTDGASSNGRSLDAFPNAALGTLPREAIDPCHVSHRQVDFTRIAADSQGVNRHAHDLPRGHLTVGGQDLHRSSVLQHHDVVPPSNGQGGGHDGCVCSSSVGGAVTVASGCDLERIGPMAQPADRVNGSRSSTSFFMTTCSLRIAARPLRVVTAAEER